jgi:hypothetical protein
MTPVEFSTFPFRKSWLDSAKARTIRRTESWTSKRSVSLVLDLSEAAERQYRAPTASQSWQPAWKAVKARDIRLVRAAG